MEENVKVTLDSAADTSGFQKFEAAHESLTAAKQQASHQNDLFVDSERRVRTNLSDLVTGLSTAQNATDAISSAVGHLTEVFQLGAFGVIAGGIGAAIVAQFSKADEAIAKTSQNLQNAVTEAQTFVDKLEKRSQPAQTEDDKELQKLRDQEDQARAKLNIGFFGTTLYGAGRSFLGNFGIGDEYKQNYDQSQAEYNRLHALRLEAEHDVTMKDESNFKNLGKTSKYRGDDPWSNLKGSAPEGVFEAAQAQREFDVHIQEEDKKASDEKARQQTEAQKQAELEKAKSARAEAKTDAQENRDSDKHERRSGREQSHIIAGHQRELGGGGGVYGGVVIDPVVTESRKQTSLLTQIAQSLSGRGSPAVAVVARAA